MAWHHDPASPLFFADVCWIILVNPEVPLGVPLGVPLMGQGTFFLKAAFLELCFSAMEAPP